MNYVQLSIHLIFYCYFSCIILLTLQPFAQAANGPKFVGLKFKTEDKLKTFYSFRGIPYALPPIANRRFKPPVPIPEYGSRTINATTESPSCAQSIVPYIAIGTEDCLYLSVYTPTIECKPDRLHAVMVWVHGGFFEIGGHTYHTYHPDYFLNQDIIVVTINYRLGIFGFLNTEDMESPGNYGLKDQIVALKWVKKYIKYFCGNESNITIVGESAGSISISYLSQSRLAEGLFNRAILQSGTSLCLWGLTRNTKEIAIEIGKSLKLNTTSTKTLLEDLRKVTYEELVMAALVYQYKNLIFQRKIEAFVFGPSIEPEHDGAVISKPSHQHLVNGNYHKIPYIIGMNSGEAFPFIKVMFQYTHLYLVKFKSFPTALVSDSLNSDGGLVKLMANQIIKSKFFYDSSTDFDNFYNFFNEDLFVRPITETIRLYSRNTQVFMYIFSYRGSFITPIVDDVTGRVGHGEELHYLFRNAFVPVSMSNQDLLVRERLIKLWTNFVKTGNPTPVEENLLEYIIWQTSKFRNNWTYLDIGNKLRLNQNFHGDYFSFWKSLFELFGNPPFSTY